MKPENGASSLGRAASGMWTVDAWAPLEGFILNGGVRLRFGGRYLHSFVIFGVKGRM